MRRTLTLLAAFAIGLAGCAGSNPPPDGDEEEKAPADALPLFTPGVVVAPDTAEPGLLLDAAQTIWLHAPGGLWKSADNGTTWSAADFSPGIVLGGDADLAIASDGTMYYTDLEELIALSVFTSTDGGSTWTENPIASDAPIVDRQWITVGLDAQPATGGKEAAYLAYNQLATGVWVTKSTDKGLTWTPHLAFSGSGVTQADIQTMGNVVVDSAGTIYVAFTLGSAGAPLTPPLTGEYAFAVVVSSDGGLTWSRQTVRTSAMSVANLFPILALDAEGTLYATWSEVTENGTDVFLSRSTDKAATWSEPLVVNSEPGSHVQPWVSTGDAPGEIAIAWYAANETAPPDAVTGSWFVRVAYARDGGADVPSFIEAQVTETSVHEGPICVYGVVCQGGRELLDFFQVRIGPDDRLHFAYASSVDGRASLYAASTRPLG